MAQRRRKKTVTRDFSEFGGSLEKMLAEMPTEYLDCRDMRHAWFKKSVNKPTRGQPYFEQVWGCRRCTTSKTRLLDARTGEIISVQNVHRGYDYPPGYLVKGVGRMRTADNNLVRLHAALRSVK